jgi:TetR/AcrR family transcriptional regulator, transcriptional repressor for nem operon
MSKGTATRARIVEKSLQLFSVKGYYNTSINDILEATQLTKGGLYGHFSSKEDIWHAVYDKAVSIWRDLVFTGVRTIDDPIERIERIIENDMKDYLGSDVFVGGCFFLNMLVELAGQSAGMSRQILKGYVRFSRLMRDWLKEADGKGLLKPGLDFREIASFIVISLNGASAIYTASRDTDIWKQTTVQLKKYLSHLRQDEET